MEKLRETVYTEEDVPLLEIFNAHRDSINFISWIPDLKLIVSCSFDCNVYVWGKNVAGTRMEKKGSLVLGNRAPTPEELEEEEEAKEAGKIPKYKRKWHINIDKKKRYDDELEDA